MFKNLMQNLSKNQKIGITIVLQVIVVIIIIACLKWVMAPASHVDIVNEKEISIPDDGWRGIKNEIWFLIQKNVPYATKSNINDAEVREETYSEITENEITTATFLLDIDSLKQTYYITISWSDTVELYDDITINCPPQSEMKYPETICYGMHNSTYSLDLYLPYKVSTPIKEEAKDIFIDGNEARRFIDVQIVACPNNFDSLKQQAKEYLDSIPTDLSGYTINYDLSSLDVNCDGAN